MKNGFNIICGLLSVLAFVLISFSIFQIVSLTNETQLVQAYQNEINGAFKERSNGKSSEEEPLSLRLVEEYAKEREFTNIKEVSYLTVTATEVVAR